jgi:hypothetical protein
MFFFAEITVAQVKLPNLFTSSYSGINGKVRRKYIVIFPIYQDFFCFF